MDLYEQHTFDPWLEESVRDEMLKDLRERWEYETHGNAVFIAAIEKRNVNQLREVILNKVKELYQVRYPYKSEHFY